MRNNFVSAHQRFCDKQYTDQNEQKKTFFASIYFVAVKKRFKRRYSTVHMQLLKYTTAENLACVYVLAAFLWKTSMNMGSSVFCFPANAFASRF